MLNVFENFFFFSIYIRLYVLDQENADEALADATADAIAAAVPDYAPCQSQCHPLCMACEVAQCPIASAVREAPPETSSDLGMPRLATISDAPTVTTQTETTEEGWYAALMFIYVFLLTYRV